MGGLHVAPQSLTWPRPDEGPAVPLPFACLSTPPPLCADSCESAGTAGYPDLIRPSGFLGAVSRQSRRGPFVGPRSSASRSSTRLHALSRACDPFEAFVFHRCLRGFPSLPVHPVVSPRVLAVLTSGFRWLLTFNCMSFLLRGAGCFVSQVVRALNQAGV